MCQLPIGQLSRIHKHIYQSQQSDTHAAYTMDIVDIHVHATIYLYIGLLLSCILFQEIQLLFTKVTFCWWHVYFYEHISGVWSIIKFRWSTIDVTRIFCLNGCSAILPLRDNFLTDCCECYIIIVYMHERRKLANQLYNRRTSMENYS